MKKTSIKNWLILLIAQLIFFSILCGVYNLLLNWVGWQISPPFLFKYAVSDTATDVNTLISRTAVTKTEELALLWVRSDLSIPRGAPTSDGRPTFKVDMAATDGVLCFIQSIDGSIFTEVAAIDVSDGQTVLWQGTDIASPVILEAHSGVVYVGGNGNVGAYHIQTGEKIWSRAFLFQRNIDHLRSVDGLVYVKTVGTTQYLLHADTGKKAKLSSKAFNPIYFQNKSMINEVEFGLGPRQIYARNILTNEILWQGDGISNAIVTNDVVYLITGDTQELFLIGLNPQSSQPVMLVAFEPTLSTLYAYTPHRLALDEDRGILYVFLGDSNQLFAFKILDYPVPNQ